ncbi:MAG: ABC transporter ATP-binding protein [Actinomycetota bacterium]
MTTTSTLEHTVTDDAVTVRGLFKYYPHPDGGTFAAVDGIDIAAHRGEVLGILGPNGAGKTTTLEIIEGLTAADGGSVSVLGLDPFVEPNEVQKRIGIQLQSSAYFEFLRLEELLNLFGDLYPKRLDPVGLLARVGLEDKRKALVGELSGGQAQRFAIVAALVNDPDVVFLDEPTTGLDPQARRNLWDVIDGLSEEGRTVILTTHYMEEAETLADRVAVIDHGRIVDLDTPTSLIDRHGSETNVRFVTDRPTSTADLERLPGVRSAANGPAGHTSHTLDVSATDVAVPALFNWAAQASVSITDLTIHRPTLEDVFLNITGRRLRD